MNISAPFIRRPVATTLLTIAVTLAGMLAFFNLPVSSLPQIDFATITVTYIPNKLCVEMKSLKLYFFSYRNKGIFYEAVVNAILDDLVATLKPRRMTITAHFAVRGGTAAKVTATHET